MISRSATYAFVFLLPFSFAYSKGFENCYTVGNLRIGKGTSPLISMGDKGNSDGLGLASVVLKRKRADNFLAVRTAPPTKTTKTNGSQYSVTGKTKRKTTTAAILSFEFLPPEGGRRQQQCQKVSQGYTKA
jgi:hypothetical protein